MDKAGPVCSASALEAADRPESLGAALCVAHLIAGVAVAFVAIGAAAVLAPLGG